MKLVGDVWYTFLRNNKRLFTPFRVLRKVNHMLHIDCDSWFNENNWRSLERIWIWDQMCYHDKTLYWVKAW